MKQVSIKLYQFSELENDTKETALEKMRDINVDHNWWDFIYDDFKTIAEFIGISVDLTKTYFSGFYHQGQGSSYTAEVDIKKLIHGIQTKAWKEYAPNQEFDFPALSIDKRVLDLIGRRIIDTYINVNPSNRGTAINISVDLNYSFNQCLNYDRIDEQLSWLEDWIEEVCKELNHFLFTSLQKEYEYPTSDKAVQETIEANEYSFTMEGKSAFCIERIAEPFHENQ